MIFSKSKFPALSALAEVENPTAEQIQAANEELKAAGINAVVLVAAAVALSAVASAEALTAAQAQVSALTTEKETLSAQLATATTELATATTDLTAMTADRDCWKTKAETFGSQPGAIPTATVLEGNDSITSGSEEDTQAIIDSLPHNVVLRNNPLFL